MAPKKNSAEKHVFLTGISGFVAGHIALLLLKSGVKLTGSVRSKQKEAHVRAVLEKHGADTSLLEFVELDLLDNEGWREAIEGHTHLIHAASPFVTTMPKDPQQLVKPAIEGTVRAINAGLSAKVDHIVLTSSVAAVAYGRGSDKSGKLTEAN